MMMLLAQSAYEGIPSLLITILQIPVFGFAVLGVIKLMMDRQLNAIGGIGAFAALILCMAITVTARDQVVSAAVLISLVSLMAFFPYAEEQIEKVQLRGIDTDQLDKAYQAVAENPQNIPARFKLAEGVYVHGLPGHAIAIGEETLRLLGTMRDPVKNMSMLDAYRAEDAMIRQWKREPQTSEGQIALACKRCGQKNPPGTIACVQCSGPYLLDLARGTDMRSKIIPRLVGGWALIAILVSVVALASLKLTGALVAITIGLAVAIVGAILWYLFKPPRIV